MSFGPRKVNFQDIFVSSLGAFIAGFLGSLIILVITFFSSGTLNISGTFKDAALGVSETGSIFPLVLSLITLVGTSITMFLTYLLLNLTSPGRYKKSIVIFGQIAFFGILSYIFFTPIYILLGMIKYEYIMYIFIAHTLIVSFGTSIILEVMNNYRHILIGIYGSFIGLFLASILSLIIFSSFSPGTAKLIALVVILPVANFAITFFKQLFEIVYYKFHLISNQDPLGDIFYQIEMEEKEELRLQEEKNLI